MGYDIAHLLRTQDDFAAFCQHHTRIRPEMLEAYTKVAQNTITDGFVHPIINFIKHIGKDVFSPKELDEALAIVTTETVDYHNGIENHELNRLENILWSQGLIGVRNNVSGKDVDIFYYFSGIGGFGTIPAAVDKYVFFPGLVDLCHLRVEPGTPVGGNL